MVAAVPPDIMLCDWRACFAFFVFLIVLIRYFIGKIFCLLFALNLVYKYIPESQVCALQGAFAHGIQERLFFFQDKLCYLCQGLKGWRKAQVTLEPLHHPSSSYLPVGP